MVWLVSDVGGTNCRFAQAAGGRLLPGSEQSYRNDDFSGFDAVLRSYLETVAAPVLDGACIAIAGPVTASQARLTNRDWIFDPGRIGQQLGSVAVHLVNDLVALGWSLPTLNPAQRAPIGPPISAHARRNGQSLVVGMGTGFNVCLVRQNPPHAPVVMEAELGHAGLTHSLSEALAGMPGLLDWQPHTLEACFAGRGYAALQAALGASSARTMAHLMGLHAADLVAAYMPLDGLIYAGGVARSVLGGSAEATFCDTFAGSGRLSRLHTGIPVSVILDDKAALSGCLAMTPEAHGARTDQ